MNRAEGAAASPFSRTSLLGLVVVGVLAFGAMLYGFSSGDSLINADGNRGHGASKSLIGYYGMAQTLRERGYDVSLSRNQAGSQEASLLVITPEIISDWEEVTALVERHRYYGPTLIILPKWFATGGDDLQRGWVRLIEAYPFKQEIAGVKIETEIADAERRSGSLRTGFGTLSEAPERLAMLAGDGLHPMVRDSVTGKTVVGYVDDGIGFDWLDRLTAYNARPAGRSADDEALEAGADDQDTDYEYVFPVVIAVDADLFNNKGFADRATALHAMEIVDALDEGQGDPVVFDLTANGLGQADNLLTLALRPPFLAATLCFLAAALLIGWSAFTRFAPPMLAARAIDFGKETLVRNSAATMRLLKREHLLRAPYAKLIRRSAMRRLGLLSLADSDAVDARLDAQTPPDIEPFSVRYQRLLAAKKPDDIAAASAALHMWKKEYL